MWRLLAVLIGGMLLDGYILGIIGSVTGPMKEELGMSTAQVGLVASMALFGILIGSPLGGWAGDKWGRKPLFMIDMGCSWSGRYCSSSSARSRCCSSCGC
jgi:MFS transporter, putative metabolite transport protein